MFPLFLDGGWKLRDRLKEKNIYIPVLWPDVMKKCGKETLEYLWAENILPLPIDQRYEKSDMQYIVESIFELWG